MDPFVGRGHFSVKMYAKTKDLGPVGGWGRALKIFVCRSNTEHDTFLDCFNRHTRLLDYVECKFC